VRRSDRATAVCMCTTSSRCFINAWRSTQYVAPILCVCARSTPQRMSVCFATTGGGGGGAGGLSSSTVYAPKKGLLALFKTRVSPTQDRFMDHGHETQRLFCMIIYSWWLHVLRAHGPWVGVVARAPVGGGGPPPPPPPLPCIAFAWQCFRRSGCVPAEFCKSSSEAPASASAAPASASASVTSATSATSGTSASRDDGTASSFWNRSAALHATASMAPGYVVYDTYMKSKPTGGTCTKT
jgi:hypothetical protein